MRGIINFFRTASFEVRVFGSSNTLANLRFAMASVSMITWPSTATQMGHPSAWSPTIASPSPA